MIDFLNFLMKVIYLFILSLTIGTTLVLLHCPNWSDDPDTATVSPAWVAHDTWNMWLLLDTILILGTCKLKIGRKLVLPLSVIYSWLNE